MNPLLSLLLIALGVFGVIFLVALVSAVIFLTVGKRYSRKQHEMLKGRITQLLDGDEALAESLLDGAELPQSCENREEIAGILEAYRAEQERIRAASLEQQQKRSQKRRILKFLTEKKDKGEWI